ncbi:MAG TPA: threonine/serine exporter family protein [Thermoclostridium caenicola]|uniref:Uncharacterized membrane protein YjjB, DUF3815 family n=1 Tax=Thermoclostridium caenicola TaxID=659425 RepID=A0A1M6DA38_9FIRM|nr:threonine/serine exporter family protein [Thermoclostridium caenicola]SHI69999.1 Uncharacterized membrane protein YjjB, DUF3815 family [Thermoclostridium caenicola]HOK42848.1 threonine/serine exporter family protein [Thermoclostridium caenicola]HOL84998.1 threonine/serine exporter family protein [Thermoclostridium caenicola]HOP72735.1 threonine/serine exporter family protein [Thermoclostridium caenicola]HPO76707.1 threonine/serine exporter family protein [Thermoclostridium caenicola]
MMTILKLLVLGFLGSVAPAVAINIEKRLLLWAGLGGMLGILTALLVNPYVVSFSISQIFAGTIVIGLYSELMAKVLKAPATVFVIPGIFPLVPGITAYKTIQAFVNNEVTEAILLGIDTIAKAFTIAFGIMLVTALFRLVRRTRVRK